MLSALNLWPAIRADECGLSGEDPAVARHPLDQVRDLTQ